MRDSKIAFITCSNNSRYYDECAWYIKQLHIPSGYEVDILCITEAESMAQGYNEAMKRSDAKYKIYLHQDVFICYKFFLDKVIEIFQTDRSIGLIGMVGGRNLPDDAMMYCAWDLGYVYCSNFDKTYPVLYSQDKKKKWMESSAIDGMLMVTQYDIPWREDLMLGWDFYDVSQSLEFLRHDYKIVVPFQQEPWCMHDCGHSKLLHYDEARKKILEEYKDFFTGKFVSDYDGELLEIQKKFFEILRAYLEQGMLEQALELRRAINTRVVDNNLQYILNILDIYSAERNSDNISKGFFEENYMWEQVKDKYNEIKFALRRIEIATDSEMKNNLIALVNDKVLSIESVKVIAEQSSVDKDMIIKMILS